MVKEEKVASILNNAGVQFSDFVDVSFYDELAPFGHRASDLMAGARSSLVYLLPVCRDVVEKFPQSYSGKCYERYVEEKFTTAIRLREIGQHVVNRFIESGFVAMFVPPGSKQYMGPLSLRHLAYYAGLASLGKTRFF